jgi:hypothetical protein
MASTPSPKRRPGGSSPGIRPLTPSEIASFQEEVRRDYEILERLYEERQAEKAAGTAARTKKTAAKA